VAHLALAALLPVGLALAAHAYAANAGAAFGFGLGLAAAGVLPLSRAAARRGRSGLLFAANTGFCLLLALLAVEWLWPEAQPDAPAAFDPGAGFCDYEAMRRSPERCRAQVEARVAHLVANRPAFLVPDPSGKQPWVLAPGVFRDAFGLEVRVNSLGFRGPELARDKGDRYRIIALGESTTFGAWVPEGDRPWPELLEARIRDELACDAPVELVNAGVPGWTLANNLGRLPEILGLAPDLLLSYHGYNGFHFFLPELPSLQVKRAPTAPERPSRLLRRLETSLRLWSFRRRYAEARALDASVLDADPLKTAYADLYAELVTRARARGVEVALSSFNMAVNAESPDEVVRVFESAFPDVRARILANRMHDRIVRAVARVHGAVFVDASAGLDGQYRDQFIDLVHLTPSGRARLTRNLFEGLRPLLARAPRLRCRPRAAADPS
jgi:lysophospholipase L1-like esterase